MPADEPDDAQLAPIARELYAHVPAEFVAARNARAAQLRQAGDKELATRVRALPKATAAAWAVGAVTREAPEELDALGELGAELRVAQASANPAELRALSRRRRELTAALARAAARLADENGVALSAAAREQVESTWQAVVIDPTAERAVRSCLLVRTLEPGGVDLDAALAVPGSVPGDPTDDERLAPVPRRRTPSSRPSAARRRPDDDDEPAPSRTRSDTRSDVARETRRAERELRSRERAAEQARADLEEAEEELSRVEAEVLQTAARIEELRRELEKLEDELAGLDEDRSAAQEEREDADERAQIAERAAEEARARLAELTE